jgi:hypothetical protein
MGSVLGSVLGSVFTPKKYRLATPVMTKKQHEEGKKQQLDPPVMTIKIN